MPKTSQRAAALVLAGAAIPAVLTGCASEPGVETPGDGAATSGPAELPAAPTTPAAGEAGSGGASEYADGTYTADGHYISPGGPTSVTVTVTLEDGIITDVEVIGHSTDRDGQNFQSRFIGGIAQEVVGLPIDELDVSHVAGSSLTSGGFNQAIEAIMEQAAS